MTAGECENLEGKGLIKAIFFDFGGVIADEGFREGLFALAERYGLDPEEVFAAGREAVHATGYVTGRGTEADFWQALRERYALQESDEVLTGDILRRFVIRPGMVQRVRELDERGLFCAILSDQTDWLERLDVQYGFCAVFDKVYNSYRLGKSKRDPSLFDDVIADLGIAPDEALFLDDKPEVAERARSRGLHAICCADEAGCLRRLDAALVGNV